MIVAAIAALALSIVTFVGWLRAELKLAEHNDSTIFKKRP